VKGTESQTVVYELDDDGVLTLTLNRPERNNAWSREMEVTLHDLLEQGSEDPDVRAVIVTGTGRFFSPGLDADELRRISSPGSTLNPPRGRPLTLPLQVPKLVVAAINGACAGIGLLTALACDVRFAAEDAKLATAFARRGLPAEEGVSWILPRIVGHGVAADQLLSARTVTGTEAVGLGLVHRAVRRDDVLPTARAYARDVATNCSPISVAAAKHQLYHDWHRSLPDSWTLARSLVGVLKESSTDFREGVSSFVEKRPPCFEGLSRPVELPSA
jgi:enoyl-CoA hydratase/carnithine racemase